MNREINKLVLVGLVSVGMALAGAVPAFAAGGSSGGGSGTVTLSTVTPAPQPVVTVVPVLGTDRLFSAGFENLSFAGWTSVDSGTNGMWLIDAAHYNGKASALVIGGTGVTDDVMLLKLSTENYTNAHLNFFYKASGLDYRAGVEFDQFFAEYSTDGSTWTPVMTVTGQTTTLIDGVWRQVMVDVPTSANLQVRFRAHLSDSGDRVWIDDVELRGNPTEISEGRCKDRIDNDRDGSIDSSDKDCAPFFNTLTVLKTGTGTGFVSSNPAGISCGIQCVGQFLKSALVSLVQIANRGSRFVGWSGACLGSLDCSVTMEASKSVTAEFTAVPAFTLTAANDGPTDGTIRSNIGGIDCGLNCSTTVYEGENIALSATPAFGKEFTGWTGDCSGLNQSCMVTVSNDVNVMAHYQPRPIGICGNGVIEWNEQCDDSNTLSGDGCSAMCTTEVVFGGFGW